MAHRVQHVSRLHRSSRPTSGALFPWNFVPPVLGASGTGSDTRPVRHTPPFPSGSLPSSGTTIRSGGRLMGPGPQPLLCCRAARVWSAPSTEVLLGPRSGSRAVAPLAALRAAREMRSSMEVRGVIRERSPSLPSSGRGRVSLVSGVALEVAGMCDWG